MARDYRQLQQFNQWLSDDFLGRMLILTELAALPPLLALPTGKHAVLIGVHEQVEFLKLASLPERTLLSPYLKHHRRSPYIEIDLQALPISNGAADLVLIPHTLEFITNPRQSFAEACRIVRPEGLLVICGFNPLSLWGLKKMVGKTPCIPWSGTFMPSSKIKNWLDLAGFKLEQETYAFYRPPTQYAQLFHRLHFMEWAGKHFFPCLGGIYILIARAKMIPLTPIRTQWTQQISNIGHHKRLSGQIVRQTKS